MITSTPARTGAAAPDGVAVAAAGVAHDHDRAARPGMRVVTGDRPTGPLHLGHYLGTLANRVRLQELGCRVTIIVADYQVITDREAPGPVRERVRNLVAEYLAAGIDPARSVIFPHSAVPTLNQLMLPFLSLVSDAELHRNPTVKAESLASRRTLSALLLTYPVHQAADILGLQGDLVPVGRDQLPHLELARLIARRFGARYGRVFAEPQALLSATPAVLGTDGAKMSKTRGNAILLGDTEDATVAAITAARTDGQRHITYDPHTRPQVANLLAITAALAGTTPQAIADEIGDRGAAALKDRTIDVVNASLRDLRRRRRELLDDPAGLDAVLRRGAQHAAEVAGDSLDRVRAAMGMDYFS
jgi:tryptophanyl-tRNA synthetase